MRRDETTYFCGFRQGFAGLCCITLLSQDETIGETVSRSQRQKLFHWANYYCK